MARLLKYDVHCNEADVDSEVVDSEASETLAVEHVRSAEILAGAACAFGVFDGVHRGHRYIIEDMARHAREAGVPAVIITFDRDPDELFRAESTRKLMTNEERLATLASLDVDAVIAIVFSREFAAQQPDVFLESLFSGGAPSSLHVGFDLRFGSRASGTVEHLRTWGASRGMEVRPYDLLADKGAAVTATRIRNLLAEGKVERANELLGRNYTIAGVVRRGRGEGADMGIATANLEVPDQFRVIGDGVYAAYVTVAGTTYKAAVNVGIPATFADRSTATVEAHILDFAGELYGERILVEFTNFLRPMRKFDDVDELIVTIKGNIDWVRANL